MQEHTDDQILLRGKILSLELLLVIMDIAGPIWLTNEHPKHKGDSVSQFELKLSPAMGLFRYGLVVVKRPWLPLPTVANLDFLALAFVNTIEAMLASTNRGNKGSGRGDEGEEEGEEGEVLYIVAEFIAILGPFSFNHNIAKIFAGLSMAFLKLRLVLHLVQLQLYLQRRILLFGWNRLRAWLALSSQWEPGWTNN
ncbi:hypothetical protein Ancab_028230 [Ancistrocladus abbreviatus]